MQVTERSQPRRSEWSQSLVKLAIAIALTVGLSATCWAAPQDAVVRVTSHGCSAVVIRTQTGRTDLLTCAHAFKGRDRYQKVSLDVPMPVGYPHIPNGGIRVVRVDYDADLCSIEMLAGPLPYVMPVAPAGWRVREAWSIGYDSMRRLPTMRVATLVGSFGPRTYTHEIPRPGRSGGALMDSKYGYLVGIVTGYELVSPRRGIYSSHEAILKFLRQATFPADTITPALTPVPTPLYYAPRVWEERSPLTPRNCLPGGT